MGVADVAAEVRSNFSLEESSGLFCESNTGITCDCAKMNRQGFLCRGNDYRNGKPSRPNDRWKWVKFTREQIERFTSLCEAGEGNYNRPDGFSCNCETLHCRPKNGNGCHWIKTWKDTASFEECIPHRSPSSSSSPSKGEKEKKQEGPSAKCLACMYGPVKKNGVKNTCKHWRWAKGNPGLKKMCMRFCGRYGKNLCPGYT